VKSSVWFKSLDLLMKKSIDLNRDWNQWFKSHWFKSANPGQDTLETDPVMLSYSWVHIQGSAGSHACFGHEPSARWRPWWGNGIHLCRPRPALRWPHRRPCWQRNPHLYINDSQESTNWGKGKGAVPQWGLGGVLISQTSAVEPVGG